MYKISIFNILSFFIFILFSSSAVLGQVIVSNANLKVQSGAFLVVNNQSMKINTNGIVDNEGEIDVDYNFTNNGMATGAGAATGLYKIGGDWENNNTFIADNSTVHLYNADKLITGSAETNFYNLRLTGGNKLMTINASAVWLDLGVDHLLTDENIMLIDNSDPASLIFTTGFVSSRGDGHLQRKTQSTSSYIFPLGSDVGDFRLRPIEITPNDNSQNIYGARLANNNATQDGYSLKEKSALVGQLNESYYHHLYHNSGTSPADVTFYYDDTEDEIIETIAHWNNQWLILDGVTPGMGNGTFSSLTLHNFENFSPRPFVLASKTDFIYIPNAMTPNGDGKNDFFSVYYNENKLLNFDFYIFDRWGNMVYETHHANFSWDGTYKGQPLPDGAYVWKMRYQEKNNTEIVDKLGQVTILH